MEIFALMKFQISLQYSRMVFTESYLEHDEVSRCSHTLFLIRPILIIFFYVEHQTNKRLLFLFKKNSVPYIPSLFSS
jgi:hypothetical protein